MASSTGMDRATGKVLTDWAHTLQSIETILTTAYGQRVMRRYFGSAVPFILGRNMVPQTFVLWAQALHVALLQEPRVLLQQIKPLSVNRNGSAGFQLNVVYRPRGHLGDFTPAGARTVQVIQRSTSFVGFQVTGG